MRWETSNVELLVVAAMIVDSTTFSSIGICTEQLPGKVATFFRCSKSLHWLLADNKNRCFLFLYLQFRKWVHSSDRYSISGTLVVAKQLLVDGSTTRLTGCPRYGDVASSYLTIVPQALYSDWRGGVQTDVLPYNINVWEATMYGTRLGFVRPLNSGTDVQCRRDQQLWSDYRSFKRKRWSER